MKFKGTIVITDPCYVLTKEAWEKSLGSIFKQVYDQLDPSLGFTTYLMSNTGVGDWVCTVTNDDEDKLGSFCADSGMVSVFLLEEVLKHKPEFQAPTNSYGVNWATVIEDFEGEVYLEFTDGVACVEGSGNVNFYSNREGYSYE